MVDALAPGFRRMFSIVGAEKSPLWTGVFAGTAKQAAQAGVVSDAAWTLRRWQIDMINWPINNSVRWDISTYPYYARDSTRPLMREIRPPQERGVSKWNSDPFVYTDGNGMQEEVPTVWSLPYFIMLYNGLITGTSDV